MLFDLINGRMNFTSAVAYVVSALIVIFLTLPFHEFAHAFVADKLGDRTPRYQRRLTLNPLAHIDYFGALAMIVVGFGWARPVQVNANNFKNPKRDMAITALAGPVMNVILAFISLFIYFAILKFSGQRSAFTLFVLMFLSFYSEANIFLAVFNLIPIPPFDGSRILNLFLPTKYYFALMKYEQYFMLAAILLIYLGVFDGPIALVVNTIEYVIGFLPRLIFGF